METKKGRKVTKKETFIEEEDVAPVKEKKTRKTLPAAKKGKGKTRQFTSFSSEESEEEPSSKSVTPIKTKKEAALVSDETVFDLKEVIKDVPNYKNVTKTQEKKLFSITYKNSKEKILSNDRLDIFYEIAGMIASNEVPVDEIISFLDNQLTPEDVVFQQPSMLPYKIQLQREIALQLNETAPVIKNAAKCKFCSSTEVCFAIKQIRSGDEGATTFLRCVVCDKRWKEG
jgi:DNA-directed RNA polymerase subunit M/transcription elongation factor TFIIS